MESSEPGAELVQSVRVGGELTEQPAALLEHETAVMQVLAQESIQRRKEAEQRREDAEQARKDREQWQAIGTTASELKVQQGRLSDQQGLMDSQQDEIIYWSDQITQILKISRQPYATFIFSAGMSGWRRST